MSLEAIIHGTFIDAPTARSLRVRENVFVVVTNHGVIGQICTEESHIREEFRGLQIIQLEKTQAIVPGLVDLHIHAPQFKQLGTKTDIPLMEWLQKYAFPAESAFSSPAHASNVYPKLLSHLIKNGTTTAVLYGSNHLSATKILAESCDKAGIRAFVGKTCADMLTPEYYVETTEGSLKDTEEFVKWCFEKWGSGREGKIRPVVTPRLKDSEAGVMEKVGATVVSCPWSNILFARATVPIPHYNYSFPNLKIGLGTDIAGGFGTMLDNMRTAILQDRIDSFATVNRSNITTDLDIKKEKWTVDFKYAFHLATASGAKALGMEDMIGTFEEGMRFDALQLDLGLDGENGEHAKAMRFTRFGDESVEELFEKWVTTGDDRNVVKVWVDGVDVS
ncbi:hypothetical protein TWF970_004728 [Orbilia oligospora]|uniref:Amidohydrolase-related domain-containing protein n=1 Tax=Orbilia oligospora TaxID=2813651 RepID=A0A7C8RD08_ORBOL|nr:hypothetical protein TWF970_004728 [Orbilia oligospora]